MYNNIYGYSYSIPAEDPFTGIGMGIMMFYIIVMLLIGIISLTSYILRGIGLYTIAKKKECGNCSKGSHCRKVGERRGQKEETAGCGI